MVKSTKEQVLVLKVHINGYRMALNIVTHWAIGDPRGNEAGVRVHHEVKTLWV
jgi:hypothetical protein